jgi:succinyl-diaminopimelate desuccinylase
LTISPNAKPLTQKNALLLRDLRRFIQTPSVNPDDGEAAMTSAILECLAPTAMQTECVESLPGRFSVGARVTGPKPGPTLVLNGHVDTVPPGDHARWTYAPFDARVHDGRVYGLGASDMKGGLAVMVAAARHVTELRRRIAGSLVLQFAIGEERAEPGTASLIDAGYRGDVGVVLEPTSLRVGSAQRGTASIAVRITGRPGHASRPDLADNPIRALPDVLEALSQHRLELKTVTHPLLGHATCEPTMVHAGATFNIIPAACELTLDRRLVPGETIESEIQTLIELLNHSTTAAYRVDVRPAGVTIDASETPDRGYCLTQHLTRIIEAQTAVRLEAWGTPYGSDVSRLINDADMEAVTFGPGDIECAHAPDESVPITELVAAEHVIAGLIDELLIGEPT